MRLRLASLNYKRPSCRKDQVAWLYLQMTCFFSAELSETGEKNGESISSPHIDFPPRISHILLFKNALECQHNDAWWRLLAEREYFYNVLPGWPFQSENARKKRNCINVEFLFILRNAKNWSKGWRLCVKLIVKLHSILMNTRLYWFLQIFHDRHAIIICLNPTRGFVCFYSCPYAHLPPRLQADTCKNALLS